MRSTTTSGGAVLATLHLQDVLDLTPVGAGLVLLPFSLAVVAGSTGAARARASASALIAGGIALIAAGSVVAAVSLTATSGSASVVAWGVLAGLGLGAASVAATTLGTSAVGEADRATAAAQAGPPSGSPLSCSSPARPMPPQATASASRPPVVSPWSAPSC